MSARAKLLEAMPWEAECPICGSIGPDLCGHADIVSGWGKDQVQFLGVEDLEETARIEREWAS